MVRKYVESKNNSNRVVFIIAYLNTLGSVVIQVKEIGSDSRGVKSLALHTNNTDITYGPCYINTEHKAQSKP